MVVDAPAVLREKFGLRSCAGLDGCEGRPTLFRSRALSDATADDVAALKALGIETVYDLRKETERVANPEPAIVCEAFDVRTCPVDLQDDAARTQETKSRHVKAAYGKPGDRMLFLYGVMADHQAAVTRYRGGHSVRRQTCIGALRQRKRPCGRGVRQRAARLRRAGRSRYGRLSANQ